MLVHTASILPAQLHIHPHTHIGDHFMSRTPTTNQSHHAKRSPEFGALILALILALATLILLAGLSRLRADSEGAGGTTIVVDTSADLNPGSNTQTCTYSSGALFVPAPDGCTLRRALREAAGRPQSDRPIRIEFNLAPGDPNANLEVAGTWTLPINGANALPPLKTDTIININGQVTIDGSTQPGGRALGPKIIIDTGDRSLEVESTNNVIRHLSFKGGGVIFLKEDNNLVEYVWMGLSDDGQSIAFRTPGQPVRMAGGGIHISSNGNTVRNVTISGAYAKAIDIDGGSNNLIEDNLIGTRSDGTVPTIPVSIQCQRSLSIDPANWYGGWGIALSGSNNQIVNNRIAGLHILQSANDTPPIAIEALGNTHEISGNIIGVDKANKEVGVCGQGIKVAGNGTQILDNQIVRSRAGFEDDEESAILSSDSSPTFGSVTVRGNIVKDGPGKVYAFGPGIPEVLRVFKPAKVTSINGVTVQGGSGDASPCPNCIIDFYLDDGDTVAEALSHLGSVVANGSGNFTFTLPQTLAAGQGIRTMSTSQQSGVIAGKGAGTTTQTSILYTPVVPIASVTIGGPTTGMTNTSYEFTIAVGPANVTLPLNYLISATGYQPQSIANSTALALEGPYSWSTPGVKTIEVRVENAGGVMTRSHQITISAPTGGTPTPVPPSSSGKIFIPVVSR